MVVLDLALGILSNFMYDSATKNTQSDCLYSIYDKSIKQLTKKYNKLEEYHIETFLHEDNVQKAINNYLKHLNQNETFSILKTEFFKLLNKSYFTEDDAELILNDFFQILNEAIEQDDQLREYLKLYLLKDTHNDLKDMKEMLKASSEGPGNINYDAHIENYLNQILDGKLFLNTSIFYTELSLLEISVKDIFPLTLKTENENKTEEFEISDVVEKESKIIISGESGSGKTTTLRWLTYTYAKKCLEENNPYIPFYVELNNYVEGTFLDYIITCAKEYGLAEEATKMLFEDKIKDKNVILLIDGLDLLTDTNEFIPYTYISNFITGHPSFRYIISSRPGFIDRFNKKEFKIFEIHELTEDKMKSFIDRYLGDQKEISEIIINEILSNKNVSMFKNPLMLFFAINIAFSRLEEETILPSTRTKLYEYFIENLLSHYKEKGKKLNSDWLQIEGVANNLYFVIQSQNLIRYERKYALKIAEKKSKEIAEEYGLHTVRGLDVLDDLFSLGLFNKEREYVTYGFHQSFQEYFSAAKLKELFENGTDISSAFNHPKWENVVIFISEMIENPDLLVESIIENGELNLASKCAKNTSIELKKKLCTLLSNKMGSRFIVEKMNATNSLGMLGICDDLLIEALRDDDKYVRQSASEVLGEIKSERAVEPLIEALRDDDKYVRQSAIRALIEIKSEKAVELLFYVLKDKNLIVKVGATVALSR
ncbi:MAG: hypothetical protein PWQ50_1365 [Methanolobus sp.]|nr:hypothetical protein [Methanolobus sp.]